MWSIVDGSWKLPSFTETTSICFQMQTFTWSSLYLLPRNPHSSLSFVSAKICLAQLQPCFTSYLLLFSFGPMVVDSFWQHHLIAELRSMVLWICLRRRLEIHKNVKAGNFMWISCVGMEGVQYIFHSIFPFLRGGFIVQAWSLQCPSNAIWLFKYTSLKTTLPNAIPNWKWRRHLKSSM